MEASSSYSPNRSAAFSPSRTNPGDLKSPTTPLSPREPPSCVQNAMMNKDKKPFTYLPGGLDLSQIRSEKMARRLMINAMSPGVQERPKAPTFTPTGETHPAKPPVNYYSMPVPVFPCIQIPANPKKLLRRTSGPFSRGDSAEKTPERTTSTPKTGTVNGFFKESEQNQAVNSKVLEVLTQKQSNRVGEQTKDEKLLGEKIIELNGSRKEDAESKTNEILNTTKMKDVCDLDVKNRKSEPVVNGESKVNGGSIAMNGGAKETGNKSEVMELRKNVETDKLKMKGEQECLENIASKTNGSLEECASQIKRNLEKIQERIKGNMTNNLEMRKQNEKECEKISNEVEESSQKNEEVNNGCPVKESIDLNKIQVDLKRSPSKSKEEENKKDAEPVYKMKLSQPNEISTGAITNEGTECEKSLEDRENKTPDSPLEERLSPAKIIAQINALSSTTSPSPKKLTRKSSNSSTSSKSSSSSSKSSASNNLLSPKKASSRGSLSPRKSSSSESSTSSEKFLSPSPMLSTSSSSSSTSSSSSSSSSPSSFVSSPSKELPSPKNTPSSMPSTPFKESSLPKNSPSPMPPNTDNLSSLPSKESSIAKNSASPMHHNSTNSPSLSSKESSIAKTSPSPILSDSKSSPTSFEASKSIPDSVMVTSNQSLSPTAFTSTNETHLTISPSLLKSPSPLQTELSNSSRRSQSPMLHIIKESRRSQSPMPFYLSPSQTLPLENSNNTTSREKSLTPASSHITKASTSPCKSSSPPKTFPPSRCLFSPRNSPRREISTDKQTDLIEVDTKQFDRILSEMIPVEKQENLNGLNEKDQNKSSERFQNSPYTLDTSSISQNTEMRSPSPSRLSMDVSKCLDNLPSLNVCTKRFSFLRDTPPKDDPFSILTGISAKICQVPKSTPQPKESVTRLEIVPPWKPTETKNEPEIKALTEVLPPWVKDFKDTQVKPVETSFGVPKESNVDNVWKSETWSQPNYYMDDAIPLTVNSKKDVEPAWKKELKEIAKQKRESKQESEEYKMTMEPPWKRELRELSQAKETTKRGSVEIKPNFDQAWKPSFNTNLQDKNNSLSPSASWSQTMRPKSWKERNADLCREREVEVPEWKRVGNAGKSFVNSFLRNSQNKEMRKTPEITVEIAGQPSSTIAGPVSNNGYTYPWESSPESSVAFSPEPFLSDRTPTPQSRNSPYRQSSLYPPYSGVQSPVIPREYGTLSFQPNRRHQIRSCPIQSRSFKYLQLLTGTDDSFEDDEPFVPQPAQHAHLRPENP